jgi:predicted tellurium resistance membrane protein TerC
MELLFDPQVWLSFLTLAVLEIVLGIDNIIFLSILVDRLPSARRASARFVGLSFAMLTRIALLLSVVWLARSRRPLFAVLGHDISGRNLILFGGGVFLVVNSILEIREMKSGRTGERRAGRLDGFWMIILQISVIDIVFSLDSVFTAVGLAKQISVMVAAILASGAAMMMVASAVGAFIARYPTIKVLALVFLALVGGELMAQSLEWEIPQGYLYVAMAFSAIVEWINLWLGRRPKA